MIGSLLEEETKGGPAVGWLVGLASFGVGGRVLTTERCKGCDGEVFSAGLPVPGGLEKMK